jgi:hypothetical protein
MFAKLFRPFAWWTLGLATASAIIMMSMGRTNLPHRAALAANSRGEPLPKVAPLSPEEIEKVDNPKVLPGKVHWHASFAEAKLASEKSHKPVLLFHMFGYLDRQYCCSNARIARTVLFSSDKIAKYINATFEPVWESVRPAPLVTLDFGNGHTVRRTLHGNIATYICGSDGAVYDILPGIYSPAVYRSQLEACKTLADPACSRTGNELTAFLRDYHTQKVDLLSMTVPTPQMRIVAPMGGGFKGGTVNPPAGAGGGFAGVDARHLESRGIEGPTERVIMLGLGAASPPVTVPQVPLADRPELALDAQVNEVIRRRIVHQYLATAGMIRPAEMKKWLFKEVLRVDLDDPLLGLGPVLTANYPFEVEDRVIGQKSATATRNHTLPKP